MVPTNSAVAVAESFNWTNLAPREHLVQIYASDSALLESLEDYVRSGIENGEVVVLIMTNKHQLALDERLVAQGFDLEGAQSHQLYVTFDADEALKKFMVKDWPDEALFNHFVHRIVDRANGHRVRAFGEMVALLLARGQGAAMLRLEQLWQRACESHDLVLFCAYPHSEFTPGMGSSARAVCAAHTCVIK
jgi:hypothetical protein